MNASVRLSPCERLTATIHGCPRAGSGPGVDRLGRADGVAGYRHAFGAAADQPAPYQSERRRADDAKQRHPVGHQREIDRELVAAGDKFLGAVKRIDQKKAGAIGRVGTMQALLGERGDRGKQTRQPIGDDAIGGQIRLGHRRSVGLSVDRHGAPIHRKNRGTGPGDEIGQGFHERRRGFTTDDRRGLVLL